MIPNAIAMVFSSLWRIGTSNASRSTMKTTETKPGHFRVEIHTKINSSLYKLLQRTNRFNMYSRVRG